MKPLLRRDQRSGLSGKMIFTLDVRADLSAEEISAAGTYMFYAEERRRSGSILIAWYRLAAASLMLALFLLIDFFLARVPLCVAASAGPANGPPDPR